MSTPGFIFALKTLVGRTEPVAHVDGLATCGERLELLNEEVYVAADNALLFKQGLLAERMSKCSPLPRMVLVVRHGERSRTRNVLDGSDTRRCTVSPRPAYQLEYCILNWVLVELRMSLAVAIDVLPCLRVCER